MSGLPGYDNWLSAPYDDQPEPIEPTDAQFEQAVHDEIKDGGLLSEYMAESLCDLTTGVQLFDAHEGLPLRDGTQQDDEYRDALTAWFTAVIDGFKACNFDVIESRAQQIALDALQED